MNWAGGVKETPEEVFKSKRGKEGRQATKGIFARKLKPMGEAPRNGYRALRDKRKQGQAPSINCWLRASEEAQYSESSECCTTHSRLQRDKRPWEE